jgi:hypothetical protein
MAQPAQDPVPDPEANPTPASDEAAPKTWWDRNSGYVIAGIAVLLVVLLIVFNMN